MGKVTVFTSLTLDGVMQAPGRPDEDTRGGFRHGGWALPYNDPVLGQVASEGMAGGGAILLGRRTYLDFAGFWPKQKDNPLTDVLNDTQKYVASPTLSDPLPWANSTRWKETCRKPSRRSRLGRMGTWWCSAVARSCRPS